MIKFRRGSTESWRDPKKAVILESGQPGFDKNKNKIKVGDGEKSWSELPYASGLFAEEILSSEAEAKKRYDKDNEDSTLITFGTTAPNKSTVGRIYLQQNSNTDYIVETGTHNNWFYQVYASGLMKCHGNFVVETNVIDSIDGTGLYCSSGSFKKDYPKTFKTTPTEVVSIQAANGLSWLANNGMNTISSTGSYIIISPISSSGGKYNISISVEGMKK